TILLALPIVLVGVVLISGAVGGKPFGADPTLGAVLGLAVALCYAGYLLIIRRGGRDLRRPAGPVAVATASTAVVAAVAGIAVGDLDLTPGPESLFWLAMLGFTSQFLGYLLISVSLPRLPAVGTSIIPPPQPGVDGARASCARGVAWRSVGRGGGGGAPPPPPRVAGVGLVIGGIAVATVPAG